jgi:nucleoside-diphosphate-sugar epimerase
MPHILLVGATGTIGSALARSLLFTGSHTVYGLARNPAKASQLAVQEVTPVIGDIKNPNAYLELLRTKHIDVVVDASGAGPEILQLLEQLVEVGKERLETYKKLGITGPKLAFVYVSGMWVHGSSKTNVVSDSDPFVGTEKAMNPAVTMVGWRPEVERTVLSAKTREVLDTAVARAAMTYGLEGAIWGGYFGAILTAMKEGKEKVELGLDPEACIPLVHTDDVGAGIAAVVEKVNTFSGTGVYPCFDLMGSMEGLRAIIEAVGRVWGYKGQVVLTGVKDGDVFGEAVGASVFGDSGRARSLLGWWPRRMSMLQGINVYANAWRAGIERGGK